MNRTPEQITKRIYYLSRRPHVRDYMIKKYGLRIFEMRSAAQFKFLPKKTQKAVEELKSYNCEIKYIIK